jgi:hypothetical protein
MADNEKPLTKQDLLEALAGFEARFDQKLGGMEARFDQKLSELETRFDHKIEALETRLLTAFHGYGERFERRVHRLEQNEAVTAERLTSLEASNILIGLERRMREVERRLNIPPLPPL